MFDDLYRISCAIAWISRCAAVPDLLADVLFHEGRDDVARCL